jgi:hypothetical protein
MQKKLQDKMNDYSRFGIVLLSLSGFIFLGLVIPYEGKQPMHQIGIIVSVFLLLIASFITFKISLSIKNKLEELSS